MALARRSAGMDPIPCVTQSYRGFWVAPTPMGSLRLGRDPGRRSDWSWSSHFGVSNVLVVPLSR